MSPCTRKRLSRRLTCPEFLWGMLSKFLPRGLVNAGFNLLELPAGINTWAGGIAWRELLIRISVLELMGLSATGGYRIGDWLMEGLFEIWNDDACIDIQ